MILVAGASGRLGREVVRELKLQGHRVRALARSPFQCEADEIWAADALQAASLAGVMEGVSRVVSCLGASVIPMTQHGRRTFSQIDLPANENLIRAAEEAGVERFLYLSVFGHTLLPGSDFVRAHERVVDLLRGSTLDYAVIRPTGFFDSMQQIMQVASRGLMPEFKGGSAKTNPIHESDLAELCVKTLFDRRPRLEVDAGGPEILTRRQIAELSGGGLAVPVGLLRLAGVIHRLFNPRVADLMSFIADILSVDMIAPAHGHRRMTSTPAPASRREILRARN